MIGHPSILPEAFHQSAAYTQWMIQQLSPSFGSSGIRQ
jgi:hypothetical protein